MRDIVTVWTAIYAVIAGLGALFALGDPAGGAALPGAALAWTFGGLVALSAAAGAWRALGRGGGARA